MLQEHSCEDPSLLPELRAPLESALGLPRALPDQVVVREIIVCCNQCTATRDGTTKEAPCIAVCAQQMLANAGPMLTDTIETAAECLIILTNTSVSISQSTTS